MDIYFSIFAIVGALLIGAMSPGPSFILVVQTSAATSRKNGLSMAMGLGTGSLIFGICALLGLQVLFQSVDFLFWSFKILGGSYLLFLAFKIWKGASTKFNLDNQASAKEQSLARSFFWGLSTQLSNPKTAIVFASVFATFLNQNLNLWQTCLLLGLIFLTETIWYCLIALVFSANRAQNTYLNLKTTIDRAAAGILAAMGLKLLLSKS